MLLSVNFPSWIHPQIFPGVPVLGIIRWYGLMYIFAFTTAYFILSKLLKKGLLDTPETKANADEMFNFFASTVLFLLIGARVFSTLVYDTSGLFWKKPWLIFWPYDSSGTFTGLAGMSYHGGAVGALLAMIFWCIKNKKPVLQWIDAMALAIPLGYTFGRLGNFLNGELYGRITTAPWGIVFPAARKFSVSMPWVSDFAQKAGILIEENMRMINLPRHPSQLYEALFEGIILWVILWLLKDKKPFHGFLTGLYLIGYGTARFIIEYFREPDLELGYRIAAVPDAPTYINQSLLNLSTGQILCILMVAGGTIFLTVRFIYLKRSKK